MSKQNEIDRQIESIEGMVRALESAADPVLRSNAKELVRALMQMHGACLERMLEIVGQTGALGQPIIDSFASDEKVRSLLLLYDLHPVAIETRILQALEKTRPYLRSHGGNVGLVGLDEAGVVTLRLEGTCDGCPSSEATLKLAVEQAIYDAAPDVTAIKVEGALQDQRPALAFVPLATLQDGNPHLKSSEVEWEDVVGLEALPVGNLQAFDVAGQSVVICRLGDVFYAYNDDCAGCHQPLGRASLHGKVLSCGVCGQQFDVERAGRGLVLDHLHLEPVPLLKENGRALIALDSSRIQRSAR